MALAAFGWAVIGVVAERQRLFVVVVLVVLVAGSAQFACQTIGQRIVVVVVWLGRGRRGTGARRCTGGAQVNGGVGLRVCAFGRFCMYNKYSQNLQKNAIHLLTILIEC